MADRNKMVPRARRSVSPAVQSLTASMQKWLETDTNPVQDCPCDGQPSMRQLEEAAWQPWAVQKYPFGASHWSHERQQQQWDGRGGWFCATHCHHRLWSSPAGLNITWMTPQAVATGSTSTPIFPYHFWWQTSWQGQQVGTHPTWYPRLSSRCA